jgi:hypothetical protein
MAMIEDKMRNIEKNLQEEREKKTAKWGILNPCGKLIACIKPRETRPKN